MGRLRCALAFVSLLGIGCGGSETTASNRDTTTPSRLRIAVIPKGTTHEFWKAIHAGADRAGQEEKVEILWKGPLKEDDLKGQIDVVQSFLSQKVSGIVLAPLSEKALVASVKSAARQKIPVVIVDSALKSEDYVSFIATDNQAAGRLGAEHLVRLVGQKGSVVLLRYQEGTASTAYREQGFLEAIGQHPDVKIVSDNQYGGVTTETAFATSESLLLSQKAATGAVHGIFTPNESTTFGMLLALRRAGLAGRIRLVGFDASEKLIEALEKGEIDGLVVQDPFKMGYLSVKNLIRHLRGQSVEKRVDTGATLVTRESLQDPNVRTLLESSLTARRGLSDKGISRR